MPTRASNIVLRAKDEATGIIGRVSSSLRGLGGVAALVGGLALGKTLVNGLKEASAAAAFQEESDIRLAQSLRLIGVESDFAVQRVKAMSSSLQDLTGVGDETIQRGQAMLISMGKLRGEGLERATRAALDMAAVTGNVQGAFDLVSKAAVGYTSTLSRYGIILDKNIPQSEKFAAALDKINELFGGQAEARLDTFNGRLDEFKGRVGDLLETLGGPINELIKPLLVTMSGVVKRVNEAISALGRLPKAVQEQVDVWERLQEIVQATTQNIDPQLSAMLPPIELLEHYLDTLRTAQGDTRRFTESMTAEVVDRLFKAQQEMDELFEDLLRKMNISMRELRDIADRASDDSSTRRLVEAYDRIGALLKTAGEEFGIVAEAAGDTSAQQLLRIKRLKEELFADRPSSIPVPDQEPFEVQRPDLDALAANILAWLTTRQQQVRDANARLLQEELAATDELSNARLDVLLTMAEREHLMRMESVRGNHEAEQILEAAHQKELERIRREHADKRVETEEQVTQHEQQLREATLLQAAQALRTVFGKSKGAAIAAAIIETWVAVNRALALPPRPPQTIPMAVLTATMGLANVAKIRSQEGRFAFGGIVTGPSAFTDALSARVTSGELVADTTLTEARAILSGRAAIVPTGGQGQDHVLAAAQSLRGSVLDGDRLARWFEKNWRGLSAGLDELVLREG